MNRSSSSPERARGHHGRFDELKREFERVNKIERERIEDSEPQKRKDGEPDSPRLSTPPVSRIPPFFNPIEASPVHPEAKTAPYRNIYYGTLFLSSTVAMLTRFR